MTKFICPVCFYDGLLDPPEAYTICDCCGTEFENDDEEFTHEELRTEWLRSGANWFFGDPPAGWNAWKQAQVYKVSPGQTRYFIITADSSPMYSVRISPDSAHRETYSTVKGAIDVFTEEAEGFYVSANNREVLCPNY
jgi:hypothetical protein